MIDYVEQIFIPYVKSKREELGLDATYPALAIFDEFNGLMLYLADSKRITSIMS